MSVSIITSCKDRVKPLTISLSSWIQFDEVDEIIITDWNSQDPIDHLTRLSKKVKVIRVNNEPYFNQPQPLNLASSLVKNEAILKLDCDYILNPYFNFFDSYKVTDDSFIFGYKVEEPGMDLYFLSPLRGLLYVKSDIFKSVGGYNENMGKYYSVEDDELCVRLMSYGLKPISIDTQKFTSLHIPHTDRDRLKNFESFDSIKDVLIKNKKDLKEKQLYSYMIKLSKNKNFDSYPGAFKMVDMYNEFSRLNISSLESLQSFTTSQKSFINALNDIDYFSEPLYKWEVTQLTDQTYEAVKI